MSAGGAAFGFYSVFHLLWLMPLAFLLVYGIVGIGVIGVAIGVLCYLSQH